MKSYYLPEHEEPKDKHLLPVTNLTPEEIAKSVIRNMVKRFELGTADLPVDIRVFDNDGVEWRYEVDLHAELICTYTPGKPEEKTEEQPGG